MNTDILKRNIPGWSFIGCGIAMVAAGLFLYILAWRFVRTASRAQGTITGVEAKPNKDKKIYYYPVYKFLDSQGGGHEIHADIPRESPTAWVVGNKVPVLYVPGDPQKAKMDDFGDVWGMAFETCIIGAFFVVFGLVFSLVAYVTWKIGQRRSVARARQAAIDASGIPPATAPGEVAYKWTRDIARNAARSFALGRQNVTGIAASFIVVAAILGMTFTGNRGGIVPFLACIFVFFAFLLVRRKFVWRKFYKELREEIVTVSIAAEDITFRTSGRVTTMKWPLVRELRVFPEALLLVMDAARSSYTGMPAAPLGMEFRKALEDKVRGHGGKVWHYRKRSVEEMGLAEKILAYGTLIFFFLVTPGVVGALVKVLPKQEHHTLFNYTGFVLMAIWPVAHYWGYFGRNKVCAAIAALVHNLFGSVVIAAVWYPDSGKHHLSLALRCGATLFMSGFLILGFLLVRFRVTKRRAAVYIYAAISVVVILSVMLEAALE